MPKYTTTTTHVTLLVRLWCLNVWYSLVLNVAGD